MHRVTALHAWRSNAGLVGQSWRWQHLVVAAGREQPPYCSLLVAEQHPASALHGLAWFAVHQEGSLADLEQLWRQTPAVHAVPQASQLLAPAVHAEDDVDQRRDECQPAE